MFPSKKIKVFSHAIATTVILAGSVDAFAVDTGPTGPRGPAGPRGVQGLPGPAGGVGPAGLAGARGPAGQQGVTGPRGASGPVGATGARGLIGPIGPQGAPGPTGAQGPVGAAGAMGPAGATGATGPTGAQGPAGATGAAGLDGAQGPQGAGGVSSFLMVTAPVVYSGTVFPGEFNFNQIKHMSSFGSDISITGADATHDGHIMVSSAGKYQITFSINPNDNNGAVDAVNSTSLSLTPDHCAAELTINNGNWQGIGATAFYTGVLNSGIYKYNTGGASTVLSLNQNDKIQIGPILAWEPCVAEDNNGWARKIGTITVVKLN